MSTMAMSTMPMYGLPPSYVPSMVTQAQTQLGLGVVTTSFQNPLYTNTIMTNLHPFGSLPRPSAGPNIGNPVMGPVYPNMPKSMPLATPSYTNESLATFR